MIGSLKRYAGMGGVGAVSFSAANVSASDTAPPNVVAGISFTASGFYSKNENGSSTQLGSWIDPQRGMAAFKIRYKNFTGDALFSPTMAENTLHSFSDGDVTLQLSTGSGNKSCSFTVEILLGDTVKDSASFSLSATAS